MLRNLAFRLIAATCALGIGLLLCEVALRMLPVDREPAPSTRYKERHHSRMDSPDFRERDPEMAKRPGSYRILSLGDSYAWGSGIHAEDAYPDRVERGLRRLRPDLDVEVVNWSRPGWNTVQQLNSVRGNLDALDPDLVLVGFVLNDAEPVVKARRDLRKADLDRRLPRPGASAWLHSRSRLYRLGWERLENSRQRRAFTTYYRSLYSGPHWQRCRDALGELRLVAEARSAPLLVAIFPVFDSTLDARYPYADLHRKVDRAAGRLGIPTLDLLEAYLGIDPRRLAVTPFTDPHPNELAHRIAADRIVEYIVQSDWLPPPA